MAAARVHRPPRRCPTAGYFSGQSALVSLSGAAPRDGGAAAGRRPARRRFDELPRRRTTRGPSWASIAHARQTLLDAGWHARRWKAFEAGRPHRQAAAVRPALEALRPALDGKLPVVFEADTRDEIHRALDFAAEFKLKPILLGGRDAWKVVDRLKAKKVPVHPAARLHRARRRGEKRAARPRVREDRERQRKEEQALRRGLHKAGVRFAFTTQGLPATGRGEVPRRTCARPSPPACRPTRRSRP